ncbi:transposase [Paenibacillus sabinae]|uniref:Transposase IS3/IS911 family protein n=1 Tax=Paenibacillus sabinae T27 TaxID=1268072 RepID=X4ZF42_9BACL|nr:transposase [Paenibacillus sabinae]AHV95355.1 transposase IS3/IS911 family protein [Paenibacillus sabinae T27]AHV96408.1 transposase IS3/IS911 family protein [Paenibacillus sabinae T27]AHV96452.1 transposase IS3/IS911 family protein [Paenibacillus sabinae T27]AHV97691.1 transposase IS3/IS911 family protein [Paenibacillus sabinae T27]AHV98732.1 transposase IS3/IS911 family protein [Paenibacillus sabinae T27]
MSEPRKQYNEEFKKQTVKYLQEQTKSVEDIALELNIPVKTLYAWKAKYREFKNEPIASLDRVRELEQLLKEKERELHESQQRAADAEEELAIVKKAVHIFSKPKN